MIFRSKIPPSPSLYPPLISLWGRGSTSTSVTFSIVAPPSRRIGRWSAAKIKVEVSSYRIRTFLELFRVFNFVINRVQKKHNRFCGNRWPPKIWQRYMKIVITKPELVIFRIWNVALYTALLLQAQEKLEVEWGTVGKACVCSFKICNQLWSFVSRKAITWQRNTSIFSDFTDDFVWLPCPWNLISAWKRP